VEEGSFSFSGFGIASDFGIRVSDFFAGGGMRHGKRLTGLLLGMCTGLGVTGCFTGGIYQVAGPESLATDLTVEAAPRVTRLQQVDLSDPRFRPQLSPPAPASGSQTPASAPPAPPPPPPTTGNNPIQQLSLTRSKSVRVSVRAWVNGKPIFEDEVMQAIAPSAMRDLSLMAEPRRSEHLAVVYNQALDGIIDQEVAYQDAVHKLEAGNKRALEKLRKISEEKFEEQMKKIRDSNKANEAQIKEVAHLLKKQTERGLISGEYLRSRIYPIAMQQASAREVKEYYDTHRNEFMRLDTVQWQDVFIAVGAQRPTVAQAKRFAEKLIAQCRTPDDFAKLVQFDDGDSKFRNGDGLGTHKGEIKPPEVEDVLFRLKEGQIGPVIEMSSGVHIVRVNKREHAGLTPLDQKTQRLIENKIKNQVFDHEYKRIIRELRGRATIEIERE
jgi:parvulin-like peptidyl-prolyl isomerase